MGLRSRYSRRQFLKLGGAAAVVALLDVTDLVSPRGVVAATHHRWTITDGLPAGGSFDTSTLESGEPFTAIDVSWLVDDPTASVSAFVRVTDDNRTWSDWIALHVDNHARASDDRRVYCSPLLRGGSALQVRLEAAEDAGLRELVVGVVDTASRADGGLGARATDPLIDGFIIPRSGWGADEALRHADQDLSKPILWPPEYQPVEKIIVHHTATENDPDDPAAAVRAIYYFHAVTRGWGDIGYNFLIDWQGRVYEGRYGGASVVGGHALQYNHGSIGIALLGDFEAVDPPGAAIDALVRVIGDRAPQIDVTKAADFIDLARVPNLCGHGDVLPTSCPGELTYEMLPSIRGRIAGTGPIEFPRPVLLEALQVEECEIGPSVVYEGNILEVRLTVSNPATTTLVSSDPPPGYIYDEGVDFAAAGFPKIEGTYRFGVDFKSNRGTTNPYRWGFGAPLAPGESREVVGYVRLRSRRTSTWTASVVKEYVRYVLDHDFPQRVEVADPPVGPVAASSDPGTRYFSETGHNVPPGFASYWEANGGLLRFGYPLTEAFEEVSETDGGRYLTQYFERARFEYHPEYAGTKDEILLGLLGSESTVDQRGEKPFRAVSAPAPDGDKLWFAETRHTLSGRFREYWESQGGLPIFGYPISEEFQELSATDGKSHTVQYFERNRFEYHPEYAGTRDEVLLGHLAREVLIRRGWLSGPEG